MKLLEVVLVFLAGMGLVVQAPLNARLKDALGSPFASIGLTVALSLLVLAGLAATGFGGRTRLAAIGEAPWWAWCGGLLGTTYLMASVIALPRLGAALVVVSAVCGQMVAALAIDSQGWLGVARTPLTVNRIAGALMLLAGVALIQHSPSAST